MQRLLVLTCTYRARGQRHNAVISAAPLRDNRAVMALLCRAAFSYRELGWRGLRLKLATGSEFSSPKRWTNWKNLKTFKV